MLSFNAEVIPVPDQMDDNELLIRDYADRPILRAALVSNVDVFLTGDKDFLEADISHPQIMTAAQFLEMKI